MRLTSTGAYGILTKSNNRRNDTVKTQKINMVIGTALSIHPRNWFMVDKTYPKGDKSNTAKGRGKASTAAHMAHIERNPKDGASMSHLKAREA